MMRTSLACFILALVAVSSSHAQGDAAAKPRPCTAPEYRQFDFWLGDWNVKDGSGKDVGTNHLVAMHGGCVMRESWASSGDAVTGSSLTGYDKEHGSWHQTWMDSGGGVLQLDGHWRDGKMILEGDSLDAPSRKTTQNRVSWIPLTDGRVRQWWQQSADGGKTWTTAFDGFYTRQ
jgi:hypothetical protein